MNKGLTGSSTGMFTTRRTGMVIRLTVAAAVIGAATLAWAKPVSASGRHQTHIDRPGASPAPVGDPSRCPAPAPTTPAAFAAALDALPDDQWLAGDEALSLPLPDGRILWLWGDTMQSHGFLHNSAILQDRGCFAVVKRGGSELIPNQPDGSWYWPSAAVIQGGQLYVFASHIQLAEGGLGFTPIGVDLARFELPPGGEPMLRDLLPTPSSDAPQGEAEYGAAAVRALDGYIYVYATQFVQVPGEIVFGKAVYLARVPWSSLSDLSAWRYRSSDGWSPDLSQAAQLVAPYPHGWSSSFSAWVDGSGTWVVITKENEFLGKFLISARAAEPWGPWKLTRLARIPSRGDHLRYAALAHPEQRLDSGQLLVTVCNGTLTPPSDPAKQSRPTFMEVTP
jgi:hypothetical protein